MMSSAVFTPLQTPVSAITAVAPLFVVLLAGALLGMSIRNMFASIVSKGDNREGEEREAPEDSGGGGQDGQAIGERSPSGGRSAGADSSDAAGSFGEFDRSDKTTFAELKAEYESGDLEWLDGASDETAEMEQDGSLETDERPDGSDEETTFADLKEEYKSVGLERADDADQADSGLQQGGGEGGEESSEGDAGGDESDDVSGETKIVPDEESGVAVEADDAADESDDLDDDRDDLVFFDEDIQWSGEEEEGEAVEASDEDEVDYEGDEEVDDEVEKVDDEVEDEVDEHSSIELDDTVGRSKHDETAPTIRAADEAGDGPSQVPTEESSAYEADQPEKPREPAADTVTDEHEGSDDSSRDDEAELSTAGAGERRTAGEGERRTAAGTSASGKPYLETLPEGYWAELLVIEWLDFLVGDVGHSETNRALEYYESIGWIDEEVADDLARYLEGFNAGGEGTLTIDLHRQSLSYIHQLDGGGTGAEMLL